MVNLVKSLQNMNYVSNNFVRNIVHEDDEKNRSIIRRRIYDFEGKIKDAITDDELTPEFGFLTHYFTKGIYARELFIPAGTIMTSRLHKLPRLCIISQGDVSFTSEMGTKRVRAPYTEVFPPGSKVALFTHEDTVWTAIHGTEEKDADKLEFDLIAKDHEEYFKYRELLITDKEKN